MATSIKDILVKGVLWTAIAKYSGIIISMVSSIILARMLCPEDFGIIAIANILSIFLSMFSDMGIGAAIIQKRELNENDYNHIFSCSVYLGVLLAILMILFSSPFANYYGDTRIITICRILSVVLILNTWNMVPNSLLLKNKRFKFLAKRTLIFQIIGFFITIIAVYITKSLYSLLISTTITSIGCFIVSYRQYPLKFIIKFDIHPLKKVFSYSFFIFAFNIFNYFTRNLDKLIIGKYFSLQDLGYYEKSYNLMMMPIGNITHVITPVIHPVFADYQHDLFKMAEYYSKIIKLLASISFPLGTFLFFAADNIIILLYGEKWIDSVPAFEILSISIPCQMIISTTGSVFQASNHTDWFFYAGCFHSILTIIGFFVGAIFFNVVEAIAWAFVITMTMQTIIALFIIFNIIFRVKPWMFLVPIFQSSICSIILVIFLFFVDKLQINNILCLVAQLLITLVVSCLYLQMTRQYNILGYIISKLHKNN